MVEAVQVTRDSVSDDDAVRAPHVMVARLAADPTVAEMVAWVVDHHYLAGLPADGSWAMRLGSRQGPVAARFTTLPTDLARPSDVDDPDRSLRGVGCVHLEWRPTSADMED